MSFHISTDKLKRELTREELCAIEDLGNLIQDRFGRKIYRIVVNEDKKDLTRIFGLSIAFDMREQK